MQTHTGSLIRVCDKKLIFLFLNQNICCGYSKEPSQWDVSFKHPKPMLKLMGMKIFTILWTGLGLSAAFHSVVRLLNHDNRDDLAWVRAPPVRHTRDEIRYASTYGPLDKSMWLKINFLISQPKHKLWVLKRTVLMRQFFWAPKIYV